MKLYTALELFREGLLLKRNGEPYATYQALRKRLENEGIEKTGVNDKGTKIYQITPKQLENLNKYE